MCLSFALKETTGKKKKIVAITGRETAQKDD